MNRRSIRAGSPAVTKRLWGNCWKLGKSPTDLPLERSVSCDDGGSLAPIPSPVNAKFHHADVLLDADWSERAARCSGSDDGTCKKQILAAETVEIVFQEGRPIVPERPFETGARNKADAGLRGIVGNWFRSRKQLVHMIFVAGPGDAALAVDHEPIPGDTDPASHIREPIRFRVESLAPTRRIERVDHIALDVGAGAGALDPDHPIGGDLIVAADLTAAEETARVRADALGITFPDKEQVWRGGRSLDRGIGEILATPAAADVAADVAAGPSENGHRGDDGWSFVGGPRTEIGGVRRCADRERNARGGRRGRLEAMGPPHYRGTIPPL
jgi:hypothetical protein